MSECLVHTDIVPFTSDAVFGYSMNGFFEGWIRSPGPAGLRSTLEGSYRALVALDKTNRCVVGFITCVSDGVLSAYIPLLEVLPAYRRRGIGGQLVRQMMDDLKDFYMIDLVCDD